MSSDGERVERVTERGGASATWFFDAEDCLRVIRVVLADGTVTELPDAPILGRCYDYMPRELWDRLGYEFRHRTPPPVFRRS